MLGPDGLVHEVPVRGGIRVWEPPHVENFNLSKRQPDDALVTCLVCIRWRKGDDGA